MANTTTRAREQEPNTEALDQESDEASQRVVYVTVKLGTRYHSDHVNAVWQMVRDNGPPGRFVCITDDAEGLAGEVEPLRPYQPRRFAGWLQKLTLFREDPWGIVDPMLFLDLDIVIQNRLEPLLCWDKDFAIQPAFYSGSEEDLRCNSSAFWLKPGSMPHVWGACGGGLPTPPQGDQEVIDRFLEPGHFWKWDNLVSFKKDILEPTYHPERLMARDPERSKHPPNVRDAVIVAFHGAFKPWDVLPHPLVERYYPMTEGQRQEAAAWRLREERKGALNIVHHGDPMVRITR